MMNESWKHRWQLFWSEFWNRKMWQPPRYTGYRVLALLIALCLWCYVTVSQNPLSEGTYTVPVEFRNLSADLAQPDTNYQVQVRVQSSANIIEKISSHNFVAYVDLSGVEAGEVSPAIHVELPDKVNMVSVFPESLNLSLKPSVSQSFDVFAAVTGVPDSDYMALAPVITPGSVTLSGTEESLQMVSSVLVSADIGGLDKNYRNTLSVTVTDSEGKDISSYFTVSPDTAELIVPIVKDQPEATLSVRPVTRGEVREGFHVTRIITEPAAIRAFGNRETLASLYYLETEPIDISGLSATGSYVAHLNAPDGITLSQDTVTVVVQVEPVSEAEFACVLKEGRNLPAGFACVIPETAVTVSVAGPESALDALSASRIQVYLDLSRISSVGEYTLPISVELPEEVTLLELSLSSVSVSVTSTGGDAK